jgi:peptidoglycan/LPS O-acetylase OafA/YrhL
MYARYKSSSKLVEGCLISFGTPMRLLTKVERIEQAISPPAPQFHLEYRPDVDGLRAVAILLVVGYHASSRMVPGGFIGVDVFFVLSGFLISGLILKGLGSGEFSIVDFYLRRIRRIFPALIAVFAASFVAGWWLLHSDDYRVLGKHVAAGAAFVSNFVFWREAGYFDTFAELKPMLHLWSLGIEEQFYLVWPLLLFVLWKYSRYRAWIIGIVGVSSLALNLVLAESHPLADFYSPLTRFWELLAGGALAYMTVGEFNAARHPRNFWLGESRRPNTETWLRAIASLAGVMLLAVAAVAFDRLQAYPSWRALLPVGGTLLLVAAGPRTWVNRWLLGNPVAVFVGLISYPLYLWHWPILAFLRLNNFDEPLRTQKAECIALAFVLACLTYLLVERPIRRSASGKFRLTVPVALCALMAGSMFTGLYFYATGGAPSRFPATENAVDQFSREYREHLDRYYRYGSCFLKPEQGPDAFSSDCIEPGNASGRPLVVLWGDSHAADLYLGLHDAQRDGHFTLAEFTGASCPPILAYRDKTRPFCPDMNLHVRDYIRDNKPDIVLLAAVWPSYPFQQIADTIALVKELGVATVVVIGPVPYWDGGLPKVLYFHFKQDRTDELPLRLRNTSVAGGEREVDSRLRDVSQKAGALYRSPIQLLCEGENCVTRVGPHPEDIISWDYGHLTTSGSIALVRGLLPDLLHIPPRPVVASIQ